MGDVNNRKLRLFGTACCRLIWHLLTEEDSRTTAPLAPQHLVRFAQRAQDVLPLRLCG
jgi:hypothetical protein